MLLACSINCNYSKRVVSIKFNIPRTNSPNFYFRKNEVKQRKNMVYSKFLLKHIQFIIILQEIPPTSFFIKIKVRQRKKGRLFYIFYQTIPNLLSFYMKFPQFTVQIALKYNLEWSENC